MIGVRLRARGSGPVRGMAAARRALAAILACASLLALSACEARPGAGSGAHYVIAGGGTTGVYYGYGKQLAAILTDSLEAEFSVAETDGSVDNLQRIGTGAALMGFAQSDAAAEAIRGTGAFGEPLPIRAIARLYDEYVHVVVRADSEIESLADLEGRTVSLGAKGSGVNLVSTRVMEAAGVPPERVDNPELGLDASIEALRGAEIEAFFWVGGVPTPGLQQLATGTPIRLLPIESGTVERLNSDYGGVYRISEFPLGSYGWETPTVTMTVPNYLVVGRGASPRLIREAVETLFDSRSELAQHVPAAALLDRRQAIFTDPIELHPGAVDYYVVTKR